MSQKIGAEHLARSAVIYVRQSTMTQVLGNLESQKRQYALADRRETPLRFRAVIDEDLPSGSGWHPAGFQRLVSESARRRWRRVLLELTAGTHGRAVII